MIQKSKKKGFTLIELIVVIAILSVVSGAIYTIMQMTMVTFNFSSKRTAAQSVSRLALNDMKKYLGVANSVGLSLDPPATLPATGGYLYFDTTTAQFIIKEPGGSQRKYAIDADLAPEVQLYFERIEPIDEFSDYNSIRITIQIDSFVLTTDVFVQNLATSKGKITLTFDPTDPNILHPAQYIYFE